MAFSSLTMKIESTAPTAVSSAQPGRTGSFKSLSLAWRIRAPRHQTLSSQHISPSHDLRIVSPSSQQCCHADCHSHTLALSPSIPHLLTLQCVSLLASRAALGRGSHQAAARSCPNSAQTAGPDLQRSAVSHADMQQHAAADCMHNQPQPQMVEEIWRLLKRQPSILCP